VKVQKKAAYHRWEIKREEKKTLLISSGEWSRIGGRILPRKEKRLL